MPDADQLPIPLAETEREQKDEHRAALLLVALLLGGVYGTRLLAGRPGIPISKRAKVRDALRSAFERRTGQLATKLVSTSDVRDWHGGMVDAVRGHTWQQAVVGYAGPLLIADQVQVRTAVREQMGFLYRFASKVSTLVITGATLTAGYIASRAVLYAGAGWEWFWRGNERAVGRDDGIVVVWHAIDDGHTCGNCRHAELSGPYLPSDPHPWPGAGTCEGLGRCRCSLSYEYSPEVWQALTGRRLAA